MTDEILEIINEDDEFFNYPSYSDQKAQRCLAFQCLAKAADGIIDTEIKNLALSMLTAMIQITADKPIRGLKPVD